MKILVIGLGKSGLAAIDYLLERGYTVIAIDKAPKEGFDKCPFFLESEEISPFDFDLVVVSPGIAPDHVVYRKAIERNIPLIGEAELAFREIKNQVIGVTGSNGKSTTTMLIAHILNRSGRRARALGNIGVPLISAVRTLERDEIVVAELSSFQLETMQTKIFDVAMILNVTPNHLDRHKTMENYFLAKKRIGELVKEGGAFGVQKAIHQQFQGKYEIVDEEVAMDIPEELFHIRSNIAFARFACLKMGLSEEEIVRGLAYFSCLPHRLEFVRKVRGIYCYDDSKGTTIEAVSHAVRSLKQNVILIAGGRHKGGSFSVWNESFQGKVKTIILLGEAKELIAKELQLKIPIYFANSLEEAIEKGLQVGKEGDNLVLSPGCSSYDMFVNFEERGELFKQGLERESKRYDCNFSSC